MRPLRDRLGEAMRLAAGYAVQVSGRAWDAIDEDVREHWRGKADRLLEVSAQCGVLIVKQPPRDDAP